MTKSSGYFLALIVVLALLTYSFYIQFYQNILPCPLCLLQRFTVIGLGILFLLGIFFSHQKRGALIIGTLSALFSIVGISLSGRQIWLQYFPISSTSCDMNLQYMLQALPFQDVAKRLLQGDAECAQISWQFLHLTLAQWSLIWFILFLLFSLWQLRRNSRHI